MLNARPTPAVAGSYLAGATLGAVTTGAVLLVLSGLISPVPQGVRAGILVAAVVLLALRAAGVLRFPMPQNSRQIPQEAFRSKVTSASFRFAYELGTSVRTYITKEAAYGAALVLLLVSPGTMPNAIFAALATAVGFGIGRAWIVVTQQLREAMIVEHPNWALAAANGLSLGAALWLGLSAL